MTASKSWCKVYFLLNMEGSYKLLKPQVQYWLMESILHLKPSAGIDNDGLWVYLIFFKLSRWKLDVECLWMSTEHLKYLNVVRPSLETDLNLVRGLELLSLQFSLLIFCKYIIFMVQSQSQFVSKLFWFLEEFQRRCYYKIEFFKKWAWFQEIATWK